MVYPESNKVHNISHSASTLSSDTVIQYYYQSLEGIIPTIIKCSCFKIRNIYADTCFVFASLRGYVIARLNIRVRNGTMKNYFLYFILDF